MTQAGASGVATAAAAVTPMAVSAVAEAQTSAPPTVEAIPGSIAVKLKVNGELHAVRIDPRSTLLDTLRETIHLTGTKKGCDHGQCGACTVHISGRTLQRRLQDSGSSFQRVLDEARHQMARYYLSNSALELNEAAYLLGFEDPSSFGRAFRSWEGIPPSDWRESHRSSKPN